ncbi:MAG: ADP-ribosylation factor-like protein [Promethearchaeota archaeon]
MKYLILSYFDNVYGPKIFLIAPSNADPEEFYHLTDFMNLYRPGFFYIEFGNLKCGNFLFEISSKHARGGAELILLSLAEKNGSLDPTMAHDYLERFARELMSIKDLYKAFYLKENRQDGAINETTKFSELKELFFSFFESIPREISLYKPRKKARVFIFGLDKAGKTSIINALKNMVHDDNLPPTLSVDISQILLGDISFIIYDAPGQAKFRHLWTTTTPLNQQDGLVFVMDVADKNRYKECREVLFDIANLPEIKKLPLLILFNKIDLKKPKIKHLLKEIDLESLKSRPINYFMTSAVTGEGIKESFNWLAKQL